MEHLLLVDRIQLRSMIVYWHDTVVCLSACLGDMYCGAQGRCRGWKLYHRVPRRGLLVHFFRQFCCRCNWCIVQPQNAKNLADIKSELQLETVNN